MCLPFSNYKYLVFFLQNAFPCRARTLRHNGLILSKPTKQAMAMDRKEATMVLREIMGECDGLLLMTCVSLSPTAPIRDDSFELRIHCGINDYLRRCINTVLQKHQLSMKESNSSLVIYNPQT
jgi:hypothetical protein